MYAYDPVIELKSPVFQIQLTFMYMSAPKPGIHASTTVTRGVGAFYHRKNGCGEYYKSSEYCYSIAWHQYYCISCFFKFSVFSKQVYTHVDAYTHADFNNPMTSISA